MTKQITKIWISKNGSYDRGVWFDTVRVKCRIENQKTIKTLHEFMRPLGINDYESKQFHISIEQLENILNKYNYNCDLDKLVDEFNSKVDSIWEDPRYD